VTLLEVCIDDIAGAAIAEQAGADRIELCAGLSEGGTTPSLGTVVTVLDRVKHIDVQVLIRQRGGDFVYSPAEVEAMCVDIEGISALGAPPGVKLGFAIGALTADGLIDRQAVMRMCAAAPGAPITFHKAFDLTPNLDEALETLIGLGVDRVLTSGGLGTATEGVDVLARLVKRAAGRIQILAAGGIRAHNVTEIVERSGVSEVHFKAQSPVESASSRAHIRNDYDAGSRLVTSRSLVADMVTAAGRGGSLR
jgi:copper homeostasis protein